MLADKKKRDSLTFTNSQLVLMAITAVLVVATDVLFRLPLDAQGDTGLITLALLIVVAGVVRKPGTATLVAVFAGLMALVIDPSKWGLLYTVAKLAALGIGVDVGLQIMGSPRHALSAALAAALGHMLHYFVKWAFGVLVGIPVGVVATTVTMTALQHLIFGVIGGVLGWGLLLLYDWVRQQNTQPSVTT